MDIHINIQKKDLWLLSVICVFFIGVGFVVGFGDYVNGYPEIMGHSSDEVMVNVSGNLVTLQSAINDGGLGGVKFGKGVLSPGDTIPLPQGVIDDLNCAWIVSIKKLAESSAPPAMYSVGAYVDEDRIVHHACEPDNCGPYPNPRLINYMIICN